MPAANTPRSPTPAGWTRSAPLPPSAPSGTASITRWPRQPSACSRRSCTATPPPSHTTAVPGAESTTLRSPPAVGCPGSTTSASTANSTTSPPPKSRTRIVTNLSPKRHEKPTQRASIKPRPIHNDLPVDFEVNRDVHYTALRQPLDPSTFIADLQAGMRQAYDRLDNALTTDSCGGVHFTARHGDPWISVPTLDKLPEPATLGRLKQAVVDRRGSVDLL